MGKWIRLVGATFLDWLDPKPGLRWLDVGCGNGAFTELIVDRCAPASVHGIDPSQEQLLHARTRTALRGAQFLHGDAMAQPFPDKTFDLAVTPLVGRQARCRVLARVSSVRLIFLVRWRRPRRRCKRWSVDSEATYKPSSASRGTSCRGGRWAYRELPSRVRICCSSMGERALRGRLCGPCRASSHPGCSLQR